MSPTYSILTDGVGATLSATNIIGADPLFVKEYFNIYQATSAGTALGNFVTATFTPTGLAGKNGLFGDYHLKPQLSPVSPAVDKGTVTGPWTLALNTLLQSDYDGNPRPLLGSAGVVPPFGSDIGADEVLALVPHIQVTPVALDFGSVPLLQPVQLVLTVRNLGLQNLVLSDILNFTGVDAAMFKVTSTDWSGLTPIAQGGTAHITVVFKPTSLGAKSATLNIPTNDPITPLMTVTVTGNGI